MINDNIEYSKNWILKEIFKQYDKDKNEKIIIKKIALYNLILKFIKLNENN